MIRGQPDSMAERPIYLDYQATAPTDPRVADAMLPWFTHRFGNPHSVHAIGEAAAAAVDRARRQLADLIGADAKEIIFTSGATEANNLAIKGAARFHRQRGQHIVTCVTEHKCVLESCARLEEEGVAVTRLAVDSDGLVDMAALAEALRPETVLVSIMAVNNEIGVIQPLAEIGAICRRAGVYFHTDAAQAVGKISLDVDAMAIDLMSVSGHKMYGPMGIGALYVRRRPRVRLTPLMDGGGQERGLRSGTVPTPLVVGFGAAAAVAGAEMAAEGIRLAALRARLLDGLRARIPRLRINGGMAHRLPGNLNLCFPGIVGDALLARLDGLALSTGSACNAGSTTPSYVLRGIGLDVAAALASVRIGLGRPTSEAEIDIAVREIAGAVVRLAAAAPANADA